MIKIDHGYVIAAVLTSTKTMHTYIWMAHKT